MVCSSTIQATGPALWTFNAMQHTGVQAVGSVTLAFKQDQAHWLSSSSTKNRFTWGAVHVPPAKPHACCQRGLCPLYTCRHAERPTLPRLRCQPPQSQSPCSASLHQGPSSLQLWRCAVCRLWRYVLGLVLLAQRGRGPKSPASDLGTAKSACREQGVKQRQCHR